jgi:hypothetical protein
VREANGKALSHESSHHGEIVICECKVTGVHVYRYYYIVGMYTTWELFPVASSPRGGNAIVWRKVAVSE